MAAYGRTWTLAAVLLGLFMVGCEPTATMEMNTRRQGVDARVTLNQFARGLGMRVTERSRATATLRDSANVVVLYADPGGQAFVNGVPVGRPGSVQLAGATAMVPRRFLDEIRPSLRSPVRRREPAPRLSVWRPVGHVVVDPGHGGKDPGAIAVDGSYEKAVVLDASRLLHDALETRGMEVTMTRTGDEFLPLDTRADIGNQTRCDAFISIHADSSNNPRAHGFTLYVARDAGHEAIQLAEAVEKRLAALAIPSRGVRRADYRVLVETSSPAVLVELGFLSNQQEASRLARRGYRRALADAIASGVADHMNR